MSSGKPEKRRNPRAWDSLTPPLAQWVLDAVSTMGFAQMTPVQAATMPHFMGSKDVVVEVGPIAIHMNCIT
jgi:ATP-dependent RNA helicase DDX55/SPB4